MKVSLFLVLLVCNTLSAQEYYSKLLSKGIRGERPKIIVPVNDSIKIISFTSHSDFGFEFGWMQINQNGDTLSTFMFGEPRVRSDGRNTLVMSVDTVFQLMHHRDSSHHIRVYGTSLSGDSLFRRDYDWIRPDWEIVYPRILYRRQNGEWLIVGTVLKTPYSYDVWAIHCAPDGTEIKRNIIIKDFEKIVPGPPKVDYLWAHNVIENDDGYIISLRDWIADLSSSSHIIFVDFDLQLRKRIDNGYEGLGFDYNPIDFNKDSTGIFFGSSRTLQWEEVEALGFDEWHDVQYYTMNIGMLDLEGNLLWENPLLVPFGNFLNVFAGKTVRNGDFVVCGHWQQSGDHFGFVARYNDKGDLLFCYGFPLHPAPNRWANWLIDFVEDSSGGLMLIGELLTAGSFNNNDIWLLRIPGYGCGPDYSLCMSIDSLLISSIKLLPDVDPDTPDMTMYPNPIFPGQPIHLELSGVANGPADLRWMDMQGRQVHHEKIEIFENAPSLQVPSHLGAGWYLVELKDREGRSVSAKVVVWQKF
jgi:hypothetical protein